LFHFYGAKIFVQLKKKSRGILNEKIQSSVHETKNQKDKILDWWIFELWCWNEKRNYHSTNLKATLLSEEKKFIDKLTLKPNINPDDDEEFDFGMFLVQIDEKLVKIFNFNSSKGFGDNSRRNHWTKTKGRN
jgi:hypothetical protein